MLKEFLDFLKEYKIVSLAVAFVMGEASSSLVNSFVKDVLLPIMLPLISAESWKDATFRIGPASIAYGSFLAELLNFLILAFIIFIVVRKIMHAEAETRSKNAR